MARKQITFYHSFWDAIQKLRKKDDRLSILEAIMAYGLDGEVRPMTDAAEGLFVLIKPTLDASNRKSEGRQNQDRSNNTEEPDDEKNEARPGQDNDKIPAIPDQDPSKEGKGKGENKGKDKGEGEKESYAPAPARRKKHGEFGWVLLTPEEHDRLMADLGTAELDRCIRYVDEAAQSSGNKNRWKDWNLVIRRCSREQWGMRYPNRKEPARSEILRDEDYYDEEAI